MNSGAQDAVQTRYTKRHVFCPVCCSQPALALLQLNSLAKKNFRRKRKSSLNAPCAPNCTRSAPSAHHDRKRKTTPGDHRKKGKEFSQGKRNTTLLAVKHHKHNSVSQFELRSSLQRTHQLNVAQIKQNRTLYSAIRATLDRPSAAP